MLLSRDVTCSLFLFLSFCVLVSICSLVIVSPCSLINLTHWESYFKDGAGCHRKRERKSKEASVSELDNLEDCITNISCTLSLSVSLLPRIHPHSFSLVRVYFSLSLSTPIVHVMSQERECFVCECVCVDAWIHLIPFGSEINAFKKTESSIFSFSLSLLFASPVCSLDFRAGKNSRRRNVYVSEREREREQRRERDAAM